MQQLLLKQRCDTVEMSPLSQPNQHISDSIIYPNSRVKVINIPSRHRILWNYGGNKIQDAHQDGGLEGTENL